MQIGRTSLSSRNSRFFLLGVSDSLKISFKLNSHVVNISKRCVNILIC